MSAVKPKANNQGKKVVKINDKNSASSNTSTPKQNEKVKKLQDEITELTAKLNMYQYHMDPIKLEKKFGISEDSLVNMLSNENVKLRTELAKYTSGKTIKSNDMGLPEKLEKSEKDIKKQAVEMSQKDNEISPSQDANHDLDIDKGKNDKCELQQTQSEFGQLKKEIKQLKKDNDDLKKKLFQSESKIKEEENNLKVESETPKHDDGVLQQHTIEKDRLKKTIDELNEELQTAKKLLQSESKTNLKFESETPKHDDGVLQQHTIEIDRLKKTIDDLNEKLQTANINMEQQMETLNAEKESIETEKKKIENDCSSLRIEMEQQMETLIAEKESIETEKKKIEIDCSSLRKQLEVKESQVEAMKTSSPNTDISTKTADELKKKIDEINEFQNKLTDAESNIQSLKREKESLQKKLQQEKNQRVENEQTVGKLKEEHKKLIGEKEETIKKLRKEKTIDQTKNSGKTNPGTVSLEEKFKNAQEEIDELKNRLSKVVGANIMNDNPNITDLSDENRPTKLSEKFSELYDNEWTDAYEEAENEFKTEEKGIAYLYKTLLDVFDFCKKKSEEHAKHIRDSVMTLPNAQKVRPKSAAIGVTNQRQLKEVRKSFAPMLIESVFQNYVGEKKLNFTKKENTGKFIKKCVEICWLMNSQDPPVILDTSVVDGKSFDADKFKTYTKTGKLVDYVVWPPMLLHKGGPMLCKGVAQGK